MANIASDAARFDARLEIKFLAETGLFEGYASVFHVIYSPSTNAKENARHVIGYRGGKRFVKVTATPVSIETGGPIAMIALKGNATSKPVSNA